MAELLYWIELHCRGVPIEVTGECSVSICKVWTLVASRYGFPDEDFNSGLHHHHPEAVGHCGTGEVRLVFLVVKPIPHNSIWAVEMFVLFLSLPQICFSWVWFLYFRFRSITEQYYRKADGILAMYDITDSSSFTAVRGWMDSVKVSRWRRHGWLDGKTCKTVCPNLNTDAGHRH